MGKRLRDETKQAVLAADSEHPTWSVRRIGQELSVPKSSVDRILREKRTGRCPKCGQALKEAVTPSSSL